MNINIEDILMLLGEKDIEIFKLKQQIVLLEKTVSNYKKQTDEQ